MLFVHHCFQNCLLLLNYSNAFKMLKMKLFSRLPRAKHADMFVCLWIFECLTKMFVGSSHEHDKTL